MKYKNIPFRISETNYKILRFIIQSSQLIKKIRVIRSFLKNEVIYGYKENYK